ncbi:O-acetyl-ADP-ribose deacetylase, partial [Dysosmobacter welbionis]
RRHTIGRQALRRQVPGPAVEPHADRRRPNGSRPLGQQGGDNPRQHVAAAALGQAGISGGVHQHVPRRGGGEGPVALQHQDTAMGRSKGPGGPQPVAAGEVAADAGELPVVGRQHRDPVSPGVQYIYMSPQGVYAVGVQHHRLLDLLQQIQHQLRDAISPAQSRAQSHCVTAGSPLQDFL